MTASQVSGHLAMLLFSALVAGSFSLGALSANEIAPDALMAVRFWLGALVVGMLGRAAGVMRRPFFVAPWRFVLLGGLFGAYFVLMFEGLKTAPPISLAAVFTLTPLLTAGFAWLILSQKLTPRMSVALTIGAAGAVWVIFRADVNQLMQFRVGRGDVIYFIGCLFHAAYIPLARRLNRGEGPIDFTFSILIGGAVVLTIWAWPDLRAINWATLPPIVWITLAYISVIATAATVVLLQFATLRLPSAKVMAYTYLTPTWVIVWELALGGDVPPLLVTAGLVLTLIALGLLLRDEEVVS